jgi:hypothetical protein
MENNIFICQSCGMPLGHDPKGGGRNSDYTISKKFCSFCFQNGKFTDEGTTLQEKIDKNIRIAVSKMNISEEKARAMAEMVLPTLERWKSFT